MKWMGWISCLLLIGLLAGINVSGTKKLVAEKARLEQNTKNAEQSEVNLRLTIESRKAAVAGHIASKKKELAEAKKVMAELEAKHGPLMQESNALDAKRMSALQAARTTDEPIKTPPKSPLDLAPAAGQATVHDRRITELQREIEDLRAELERIKLR